MLLVQQEDWHATNRHRLSSHVPWEHASHGNGLLHGVSPNIWADEFANGKLEMASMELSLSCIGVGLFCKNDIWQSRVEREAVQQVELIDTNGGEHDVNDGR